MDNMEVITMDSKEARDAMFHELRKTGTELEKQVVRFSESRPSGALDKRGRLAHVSTWSIAYPRS